MANTSPENRMKQIRKRDLETIKKKIKTCKSNVSKYYKAMMDCCRKLNTLTNQYGKAQTEAKARSIKAKINMAENKRQFNERLHATSVRHVEYWQNEYYRAKSMPIEQKYFFNIPF